LDRENKRIHLAFEESLVEKQEIRRESTLQSQAMDDVLKQNAILNDELKVKTDLIKELRDFYKDNAGRDERNDDLNNDTIPEAEEQSNEDIKEVPQNIVKCNECDYKTNVRIHLKSHMMAHNGQYRCQRGCKEVFKTFPLLDKHHKERHTTKQSVEFKCDKCKSSFASKQYHRQHMMTRHSNPNTPPPQVHCEFCGLIVNRGDEFLKHRRECNTE
jgi:hypothetical protein